MVNREEPDQTASYNQFELGLNRSVSVTNSYDGGGGGISRVFLQHRLGPSIYWLPYKYQALQASKKNI